MLSESQHTQRHQLASFCPCNNGYLLIMTQVYHSTVSVHCADMSDVLYRCTGHRCHHWRCRRHCRDTAHSVDIQCNQVSILHSVNHSSLHGRYSHPHAGRHNSSPHCVWQIKSIKCFFNTTVVRLQLYTDTRYYASQRIMNEVNTVNNYHITAFKQ